MKVALFMSSILEQGGGLEKYLIETASYLASNSSVEIDIITMDEKFTKDLNSLLNLYYFRKISGDTLYRESTDAIKLKLGKSKYFTVRDFKELRKKLQEYNVVYSKNEVLEAVIFKFFIGYKNLPPIIFGVHTPHHYPVVKSIQSKFHNFVYEGWIYNFLCSGVRSFHTSNKDSFSRISKQFPEKDSFLIYYPFEMSKFSKLKKESSFEVYTKENSLNILWLARLSEQKGIEDLVKLIDDINKLELSEGVLWHICGSGDLKYESLISNLSKKYKNVNYYGHIKNNNVPSLLRKMDLFLSTSKWEVSPFNIIEAQSMGIPVLSYSIPGPEDIIIDGKTGVLVKDYIQLFQSLISIIKKERKFSEIKNNIDEKFNPKNIYSQIFEMFRNTYSSYGNKK